MTQDMILDMVREGLFTIIMAAAPPLLMGLAVGLAVSIFQAATSIQEQTMAFIPKILAVLLSLILFGPYMMELLTRYFQFLVINLPDFVQPR
jgi:flagellar biosynthetic protein FliQ